MKTLLLSLTAALALPVSATTTSVSFEDFTDGTYVNEHLIAAAEGDGLAIFDLKGQLVEHITDIEALGADSRTYQDNAWIAVATEDNLLLGRMSESWQSVLALPLSFAGAGTCLYQNPTNGMLSAFTYSEEGDVAQFQLRIDGLNVTNALAENKPVRQFKIHGEPSGCVVDDVSQTLFLAEQEVGIWAYGAEAETSQTRKMFAAAPNYVEEIEGIAIAYLLDGRRLLMVGDEILGLQVFDVDSKAFIASYKPDHFDEIKPVVVSDLGLWLANTELNEPLYEFFRWKEVTIGMDLTNQVTLQPKTKGMALVKSSGETTPVSTRGDAADDPAIWVHPTDVAKSLIIGTDKKSALEVYNLEGQLLVSLKSGKPNNVDLLSFGMQGVAVVSNRDLNSLAFYQILDEQPYLRALSVDAEETENGEVLSQVNEVYGLCATSQNNEHWVSVNGKDGQVQLWQVTGSLDTLSARLSHTWQLPSQPEGCVFTKTSLLVGEEDVGVWALDLKTLAQTLVIRIEDSPLVADVEGLTTYNNWLIASSQGDSSFVVFELDTWELVGQFAIAADFDLGIDGVSDTDGLAATPIALPGYPKGILVVQDGNNVDKHFNQQNQNFKIVDWRDIEKAIAR